MVYLTSASHVWAKRVNHINVQYSHTVACPSYQVMPYRTGYESVIANRTDENFSIIAKEPGIVKQITDVTLTVQYDKIGEYTYQIGAKHGIVTGVTIPHQIVTDLKVGDKFTKNSILAFNKGFFNRSRFNKETVSYKAGYVARIALIDNTDTDDDSCLVTKELAAKLVTNQTKVYTVILDNTQTLEGLVKIGEKIDPETILCTVSNYVEGQEYDSEVMESLKQITANNPKAKMYGRISNIEVLYYLDPKEVNPSLQKLINHGDKLRQNKVARLTNKQSLTGRIDETIQVGGRKVIEGQVVLKIYIDGQIEAGVADKLVFANGLKSTIGRVETNSIISVEDGLPVDGQFAMRSVSARIVLSVYDMGVTNAILIHGSKIAAGIYFGTIKKEYNFDDIK